MNADKFKSNLATETHGSTRTVSPSVAEDFAALSVEDRRAVALWVAVQIGQLRKGGPEVDARAAYDAITGRLSAQAKKAGLTTDELTRLIDEGR